MRIITTSSELILHFSGYIENSHDRSLRLEGILTLSDAVASKVPS